MVKLDEKDKQILRLIQSNSKLTSKEIARNINSPITTVFAKIKRMEEQGIIQNYRAVLDAKKLDRGASAFVLASVAYKIPTGRTLSQKQIAEKIAKFPEVQEVHIITGDWDLLIKVKEKDVDSLGQFVIDKLRKVEGIEKTLTNVIFATAKETTEINL